MGRLKLRWSEWKKSARNLFIGKSGLSVGL